MSLYTVKRFKFLHETITLLRLHSALINQRCELQSSHLSTFFLSKFPFCNACLPFTSGHIMEETGGSRNNRENEDDDNKKVRLCK